MSKFIEDNRRQLLFTGGAAVAGFVGGRLFDKPQQPLSEPPRFNKEKEARDNNLAIRLQAIQSSSYIIPKGQNPETVYDDIYQGKLARAVRLDQQQSITTGYSIALGVRSLLPEAKKYAILFQEVRLPIKKATPFTDSVDAFRRDSSDGFWNASHEAVYNQEESGGKVLARNKSSEYGADIQLPPEDMDIVTIHLTSQVPAKIQFGLEVTYRIANETNLRQLSLPTTFDVTFVDPSNWKEVSVNNG